MQLLGRLEIKSREKISQFLNSEHVGRIASIDEKGFPHVDADGKIVSRYIGPRDWDASIYREHILKLVGQ